MGHGHGLPVCTLSRVTCNPPEEPPRHCLQLVDVVVPPQPPTILGLFFQVLRCPEDSIGLRPRSVKSTKSFSFRPRYIAGSRIGCFLEYGGYSASSSESRRSRAGALWIGSAEGPDCGRALLAPACSISPLPALSVDVLRGRFPPTNEKFLVNRSGRVGVHDALRHPGALCHDL